MTAFDALTVWLVAIVVLSYIYIMVWGRTPKELPPSSPVIDRRWRVFDREEGGYIIFAEAKLE